MLKKASLLGVFISEFETAQDEIIDDMQYLKKDIPPLRTNVNELPV